MLSVNERFGFEKEFKIFELLNHYFPNDNLKQQKRYSVIDFIGDENVFELKSRRIKLNTYSTIIISKNKYVEGLNHIKKNKNVFFIFNLLDGVFYININELHEFKTFRFAKFTTNNKTDICLFIKTTALKKLANIV